MHNGVSIRDVYVHRVGGLPVWRDKNELDGREYGVAVLPSRRCYVLS
jgi:hypothetical protein